jgi:hypothetical protein
MHSTDRKRLRAAVIKATAQAEERTEMAAPDVMTVDVVADIGNATAIVAVVIDGKADYWRQPTAKAEYFNVPTKAAADDVIIAHADGVPIALGWSALRYSDVPTAGRGDEGRYGNFTRDFVLAGIASKVKGSRVIVRRLIVTVPAEYVDQARDPLTTALRCTHPLTLPREMTIDVRRVQVEAEGAIALQAIKAEGKTLLIDGGGGTTQIALADGSRLLTARTRGTGLQRAIDIASDRIRAQYGRHLTMLERVQLEQAISGGEAFHIRTDSGRVDVAAALRAVLNRVADTVIADIKERVPAWKRSDAIYLIGGQAYHLRAQYEAAFPGIIIPKAPEYANVRGALALLNASEAGDE